MLLREFYARFFEPLKLRARAANTRRLYCSTLNSFEAHLGRRATLADLNDDDVGRFLDWFRKRPRSPYSVNKERSNLLAIWRFACRRRDEQGQPLVKDWPLVEPDAEPHDDPVAWLPEELDRLFGSIQSEPGMICGVPAAAWWYALHCVLWDSGERIRAVLSIEWRNVSLSMAWAYCPAVTRKGNRGAKKGKGFSLHPDTVDALTAIHLPKRALVFPWPYAPTYVWYRYNFILRRAGLPTDRKSKFHRMRRSFASHVEAAGGNATELLGHSSRKVTLAYLDPRIVKRQHGADILFRPGAKPIDSREGSHGRLENQAGGQPGGSG